MGGCCGVWEPFSPWISRISRHLRSYQKELENGSSGPSYQSCLNDYDVVSKSRSGTGKTGAGYSCQILSQTEVFSGASQSDYRYHGHQGKEYNYHAAVSFAQTCRIRYHGSGRKYRNSVFDLMEEIVPETRYCV